MAIFALTTALALASPTIAADASVRSSKTHSIPEVVGKTASVADHTLAAAGFGHKYKTPVGSFVILASDWTVIEQSPKAKTKAKVGTRVSITVVKTSTLPPSAENADAYYAKTYGDFASRTSTGTSDSVIQLPASVTSGILNVTYRGSDNFSISGLDSNNQSTGELPVNVIGNYTGTDTFGIDTIGNPTTALDVSGQGSWSITVAPISMAPILTLPASGTGDHVYLYNGKAAVWAVANAGESNFVVDQTGTSLFPNLAVNEIGNYSGSVPMMAGPSVIEIESDGNWSIH